MTYSVNSPNLVVQQQTVLHTFLQRKSDAVEISGVDAEREQQEPTPNYVDCTRFIGTPEEHLELTQNEKMRPQRKTVVYDPREMWWRTPAYKSLIPINRNLLLLLSLWDLMVVLTTRFWSTICGEAQSEWTFCNDMGETVFVEDLFLSTLGVGMFLLLAFRANQAYSRFWEARTQWGMVKNLCRDVTRQIMYGVGGSTGGRRRAALFVVAFASTLKLHLREERNCEPCLGNILCFQDVANLEKANVMPQFCIDCLSHYLHQQVSLGKLRELHFQNINNGLSGLINAQGALERIKNQPIPLSYTLHLRFILMVWLIVYPIHLVVHYGWFTLLMSFIVNCAVLGIEGMSCEIEAPFGYEKNGLDLDSFTLGIRRDVMEIIDRAESSVVGELFEWDTIKSRNEREWKGYQRLMSNEEKEWETPNRFSC